MVPRDMGDLLRVEDLHVEFRTHLGIVKAVRGVDFTIRSGEKVGLVGESGCGKSVTALAVMRLVPRPRGRISQGHIWIYGDNTATDVVQLDYDSAEMRAIRGRDIAMVFQEPMTSLNPSYTIGYQIMEAVLLHQKTSHELAKEITIEALHSVNMPDPREVVDRYPHHLSGGMRQRAMLAMAMACNPRLLIADEPTTALDVTVQAQILDLVKEACAQRGMAILWITHNLGVVGELCDRAMVMYLGQIVENASVGTIFRDPKHPYTRALLSCSLIETEVRRDLEPIRGSVPGPFDIPEGCGFAPRCPYAEEQCQQMPPIINIGDEQVRCWRHA